MSTQIPVMNTIAKSFPAATEAAVLRSVSLREEEIVVLSDAALDVIADRGYEAISTKTKS